jgi:TPP-dependent 2-oxoacid decarboxylase
MYVGATSEPKTRQIVEGADLVLDLGGVNLNDITTAAYSGKLDLSHFITVGLDDVRIGDDVVANVRLVADLAKTTLMTPFRHFAQVLCCGAQRRPTLDDIALHHTSSTANARVGLRR